MESKSKVRLFGSETRILFQNCKFINLDSDDCAGIFSHGIDLLNVTNCEFYNNTGMKGGGLCAWQTNMTYLSNNTFENNKAQRSDQNYVINHIKDQNKYRGGAIYINC